MTKYLIIILAFVSLSAQAKKEDAARKPASSCPEYYGAETTLEQAFEKQKAVVEKNGLTLTGCSALAKEAVDANATDGISTGQYVVTVRGIKTTSIYSCKTNKKFQAIFRVFRFQPIEDARYNGFNMIRGECATPKEEYVGAEMTMLSK